MGPCEKDVDLHKHLGVIFEIWWESNLTPAANSHVGGMGRTKTDGRTWASTSPVVESMQGFT